MYERPYLDSSVFIAGIQNEEGRGDIVRRILESAMAGKFTVYCSTFVAVEVLKDRGSPTLGSEFDELITNFLNQPFITWIELDLTLATEARRLCRTHGWHPADGVHVASAIRARCDELLMWDKRASRRLPAGTSIGGVKIVEPYWEGKTDLFTPPDV